MERWWRRVVEVRAVARPAWFAGLLTVAVAAALQVGQARDLLVQIASETLRGHLRSHAMLLASALLAAFAAWYFPRALLYVRYRFTPEGSEDAYEHIRRWLPRILGSLPLASLALASWRSGLRGYALFYLSIAALFLAAVTLRRALLPGRAKDRILLHSSLSAAGSAVYWTTAALLAVSATLLGVFLNSRVYAPQFVGALGILLVAGAVWIAFGSTASYLSSRYTWPSILGTLLLLAIVFGLWNDNHQVRTLPTGAASQARLEGRPPLGAHYRRWLETRRQGWARRTEEPFPVVVVAAEGGGIRAAYWTAVVLARLEDEIPGFSCHVYAVSGVSGGSLGAAVYSALLADRLATDAGRGCDGSSQAQATTGLLAAAREVLERDFLAPALAGLLFPDLMQRFWPIAGPSRLAFPDRAEYLETAWEVGWRQARKSDRFAADFLELWEGTTPGGQPLLHQVPSLLLNGTWVETGGRAVTSNLDVDRDATETRSWFVQLEDLLPEVGRSIALSTAVHMSARFTYLSPAGTIETPAGARRIVDGGYFENSGGLTAAELVDSLNVQCAADDCGLAVLPVALYIKNDPAQVREVADPQPFGGTLAPVRTLLETRGARGRHAEALLQSRVVERFYPFYLVPGPEATIPLGWVLSRPMREEILRQLEDLPHLDALGRLIRAPASKRDETSASGSSVPN